MLLHGGTGSWTHWVRNIRALSQHFRLVLPDLPGMGESLDVPDDSDLDGYGEFLLAAVVAGLVPAGAPFLVAGFSYGGVMTAWLAMTVATVASAIIGISATRTFKWTDLRSKLPKFKPEALAREQVVLAIGLQGGDTGRAGQGWAE